MTFPGHGSKINVRQRWPWNSYVLNTRESLKGFEPKLIRILVKLGKPTETVSRSEVKVQGFRPINL